MKKNKITKFLAEYMLLLFVIICLVTAGLMISNIVISAVKPFVNPAAYPVADDTGVLTEHQLEVFHGILDAAEDGTEIVSVPPMAMDEQREIVTHLWRKIVHNKQKIGGIRHEKENLHLSVQSDGKPLRGGQHHRGGAVPEDCACTGGCPGALRL